MAKVVGPLHSFDASGRVGGITFIKGGFVRQQIDPSNPQTAAQMNQRQKMAALGAIIRRLNQTTIDNIKANSDLLGNLSSSKWVAAIIKEGMNLDVNTLRNDYAMNVNRPTWESEATSAGLSTVELPNASDVGIAPGLQMYWLASVLYQFGVDIGDNQPPADITVINTVTTTLFG